MKDILIRKTVWVKIKDYDAYTDAMSGLLGDIVTDRGIEAGDDIGGLCDLAVCIGDGKDSRLKRFDHALLESDAETLRAEYGDWNVRITEAKLTDEMNVFLDYCMEASALIGHKLGCTQDTALGIVTAYLIEQGNHSMKVTADEIRTIYGIDHDDTE